MKLTVARLKELEPCPTAFRSFRRMFPDGAEITAGNILRQAKYAEWLWSKMKVSRYMPPVCKKGECELCDKRSMPKAIAVMKQAMKRKWG